MLHINTEQILTPGLKNILRSRFFLTKVNTDKICHTDLSQFGVNIKSHQWTDNTGCVKKPAWYCVYLTMILSISLNSVNDCVKNKSFFVVYI